MSNGGSNRGQGKGADANRGALVTAAAGLEEEMRTFEKLTDAIGRMALDSGKSLDAAAQATQQAAESHGRFGEHLRALIDAVSAARDRQQASAEALNARSEAIRARREGFEALRERFAALGEKAREINAIVQQAMALKGEAASVADLGPLMAGLDAAYERMGSVADAARELGADARAQEMLDLEREADALRQQIQSARNKLQHLRQSLGTKGPARA